MAAVVFLLAVLVVALASPIVDQIDWAAYLSRHDPVWQWQITCLNYSVYPGTIRRDAVSCATQQCSSAAECAEESAAMCDACSDCSSFGLSPQWHEGVLPELYKGSDAAGMVPNPDWTTYARGGSAGHHPSCTSTAVTGWVDSAFYGNGLLGGLVLVDAEDQLHTIRLQIGRTDVADRRHNGTAGYTGNLLFDEPRLPIGSLGLTTAGNITGGYMRVRLYEGVVEAAVNTTLGTVAFTLYAHHTRLGFVLQWNTTGGETPAASAGASLSFAPLPANCTRKGSAPPAYTYNPNVTCTGGITGGGMLVCSQSLLVGGGHATAIQSLPCAWPGTPASGCYLTVWHIANDWPLETSNTTAAANVQALMQDLQAGPSAVYQEHAQWWASYWNVSLLSIPDTVVEAMYTLQLYKYASAARAEPGDGFSRTMGPAIDLMGPWWQPSGWEMYWWDMNVPVTYWLAYTSRRFGIADTLTQWLGKSLAQMGKNPSWPGLNVSADTVGPWGTYYSSTAGFSGTSSFDLRSPWVIAPGVQMGNPTWIAHNLYLHARYAADEGMLREIVYPLLRGSVNAYLTFAYNSSDGLVHLPPSASPEYPYPDGSPKNDTNYDLMLLSWGLQTLLELVEELDLQTEPLVPAWRDVCSRLAPFPTNEYGYMVDTMHGFDLSHRHFSHLFAIYPLHLTPFSDADGGSNTTRDLISRSVDRWTGLTCNGGAGRNLCPNGFTFDGAASMSAVMGRPDAALGNLTGFIYSGLMHAATLYSEAVAWPCFESPPGMANSVQEMLLQSWGGRVRVFPALPAAWPDAVFHRLGAEGGLAVSAVQSQGVLQWVGIEAIDYTGQSTGTVRAVRLASALGPAMGVLTSPALRVADAPYGDLVFNLTVGAGPFVLYTAASGLSPPFAIAQLPGNSSQYNYWGKH